MSLEPPSLDALGRPPLAAQDRARIRDAFDGLQGRAALLVLVDPITKVARGHFAAHLPHGWKVAAGAGFAWQGKRPEAWGAIEKTWR